MAQSMFQVSRMQYDAQHEELQRLQQASILQCVSTGTVDIVHDPFRFRGP